MQFLQVCVRTCPPIHHERFRTGEHREIVEVPILLLFVGRDGEAVIRAAAEALSLRAKQFLCAVTYGLGWYR